MNNKVHLAGIGFSVIFGFSFLFSKIALNYISPMGLLAYRFLFVFLTFYVLKIFKIIKFKFERRMIFVILPVTIFQPVLYFIFETYGLNLTTSGEAGLMIALIPIFVALLSALLLKEKPNVKQLMFILVSVAGVILIQTYKRFELDSSIWGFVLLLGAVISAALFTITSKQANQTYKPSDITYLMMVAGAITFNFIYFIELTVQGQILTYVTALINWQVFIPTFILGAFVSTGGFFLVNYTLHHMPAHVSSIYANLSTIVAIIAGVLFLQETLSIYHIVGSILIIGGVYGTVISQNKKTTANISASL